jgi:hypothetical protein
LLKIVSANSTDLNSVPAVSGFTKSDTFQPSLSVDVYLIQVKNNLNFVFSYRNFAADSHNLLYNILSTCESCVNETSSVDGAVSSLNAGVRDAMEQAISSGYKSKSKFPPWFYNILRYSIVKKNYLNRRFKNKRLNFFYDKFAFYRKLVKILSSLTGVNGRNKLLKNLKSRAPTFLEIRI